MAGLTSRPIDGPDDIAALFSDMYAAGSRTFSSTHSPYKSTRF